MTRPFASTLSTRGFVTAGNAGFRPLQPVQGTAVVSLGLQRKPAGRMRGSLAPTRVEFPAGYGARRRASTTGAARSRRSSTSTRAAGSSSRSAPERTTTLGPRHSRGCASTRSRPERSQSSTSTSAAASSRRRCTPSSSRRSGLRSPPIASRRKTASPIPLVSVTGADFWKLVASGCWPLGLVGGTSVVLHRRRLPHEVRPLPRRPAVRGAIRSTRTTREGLAQARLRAAGRLAAGGDASSARPASSASRSARARASSGDDDLIVTVDLLGTRSCRSSRALRPGDAYALGLSKT